MKEHDEHFMRIALAAAIEARGRGEVPIGACLVDNMGEVIASDANRTITDTDPTAHAEIVVLRKAARIIGNYRLVGTTMYSTVEPCAMCAGALVNARVERLVFGAHDIRFGAVESIFNLCTSHDLNHRLEISSGVLAGECRPLIQDFFKERRKG